MAGAVQGVDSLLAKLASMPARAMWATNNALADASHAMEDGMKDRAPVDAGDLKDGFKASLVVQSDSLSVHEVEAEAPHTIHVEFGTSDQPAQPMMRPAFDEQAPRTINRVKTAVKAVLR